ncbi:MAG: hypothetical protein J6S30_05820 [Kiritimatiellae bacterium]|nr:hypothetical protein [Kiritimatiellia bacterium]
MKRAQAMFETLIAVLVIMLIFTGAFRISRMLAARTVLDYAAARAARAKAVGFNDFMCVKSARAAMIPVAGKRLWPVDDEADEVYRVPIYMASENYPHANGILEYEHWHTTGIDVDSGTGISPVVDAELHMRTEEFESIGRAKIESHFPFYMYDQGR